eukprot:CAMPEP_0116890096 /NCGR_PEP_ID=MMETSP0467-20121206/638_1 /TAXON_ID=283647 /ORGANISM="Mesodinium pulex, Strain SPMC105" /LENGTH=80 /DNA_ID=CAMNT_0004557521 /DNA_START=391 /DNA_END=633 /DNA_ORIENTATION=-
MVQSDYEEKYNTVLGAEEGEGGLFAKKFFGEYCPTFSLYNVKMRDLNAVVHPEYMDRVVNLSAKPFNCVLNPDLSILIAP